MKILYITPRIPFPPRKGDQVVAFHRLRTLGTRHDITLLTFVEGPEDPGADHALQPYCSRIVKIPHPLWRVGWNLLSRGPWSQLPLQVIYYRSSPFRRALEGLLKEDFDLVHGFMLRLLPYLQGHDKPVILDCNDSMQLNIARQVEITNGPMRWIYREELRRLKHYEPSIDNFVDYPIFDSPIDAKASGSKKALVIPLGVDIPPPTPPCMEPIVVFSGNMGYGPNVQAVEWFAKNCWPGIHAACPDAAFRIVGGNPSPGVVALKVVPGIEIVGRVDDMMKELKSAAVAVAPMQSGSGMQFKILEAMACGLPVVTTSLGLGAFTAVKGLEISVTDDPIEYSKLVIEMLEQRESRLRMGLFAKNFVKKNHSWNQIASDIDNIYLKCISKNTSSHQE